VCIGYARGVGARAISRQEVSVGIGFAAVPVTRGGRSFLLGRRIAKSSDLRRVYANPCEAVKADVGGRTRDLRLCEADIPPVERLSIVLGLDVDRVSRDRRDVVGVRPGRDRCGGGRGALSVDEASRPNTFR
jgi:hypothetical protein